MDKSNINDPLMLGYNSNKDVLFKKIEKIHIQKFRSLENRELILGDNLTLITGKNGTMKSTLLGLIAHPFTSPNNATDVFGEKLKTEMKDVFRLSIEYDVDQYQYYLFATTSKDEELIEVVRVYPNKKEKRHRVVVGKDNNAGRGNLSLNTSYINFRRLFPIIDTQAKDTQLKEINTSEHNKFISEGYMQIMQRPAYKEISPVSDTTSKKYTYGPANANYDYNSISSGEDNLGYILNKLYAFQSHKNDNNCLQGIFCIDEIEAGLHPVVQENLINYLIRWSEKNHVQVVATTHSLYLLQYTINLQKTRYKNNQISINMISTAFVPNDNYSILLNPDYGQAYKELTFKNPEDIENLLKVEIICEDSVAKTLIERIIKKNNIKNQLIFTDKLVDDQSGNSYTALASLMKNAPKRFDNAIFIFDPDVNLSSLKIKTPVQYMKLPSYPSGSDLCIEKSIVKYIHDLNGDDKFFKKYKKEHSAYLNDFANSNIPLSCLSDIEKLDKANVTPFKNWSKSDTNFKSYLTYVANNTDYFSDFKIELMAKINTIRQKFSLPNLEY